MKTTMKHVVIETKPWADIHALCAEAGRNCAETAWRLLGAAEGDTYVVKAVIGPGPATDAGPCHVRCDAEWQQRQLELLCKVWPGLKFLGEGHKHPAGCTCLSHTDIKTATSMAEDPDYRLGGHVLLILAVPDPTGQLAFYGWELDVESGRPALHALHFATPGLAPDDSEGTSSQQVDPDPAGVPDVLVEVNSLAACLGLDVLSVELGEDDTVDVRIGHSSSRDMSAFAVQLPSDYPTNPPRIVNGHGRSVASLLPWTPAGAFAAYVVAALPLAVLKRARRHHAARGRGAHRTAARVALRKRVGRDKVTR